MTMARDGLLPPWFARVHAVRGTPVNATIVTGASAGLLALLVDIDALAQLVSIGTLCVFCFVCAAVLARRYLPVDAGAPRAPVLLRVGGIAASALCFAFATELLAAHPSAIAFATPFLLIYIGLTASFLWLPVHTRPKRFAVPLTPFVPALGMYATLQLIASLGPIAWLRFILYYTLCTGVYCYYRGGVDPAAAAAAAAAVAAGGGAGGDAEAAAGNGVELAELLPRGAGSSSCGGAGGGEGNEGGTAAAAAHRRRGAGSDSDDAAGCGDADGAHLTGAAARRAEKRAAKVGLLAAAD
jgi:APA family basic amino acid/polyamine antiporter